MATKRPAEQEVDRSLCGGQSMATKRPADREVDRIQGPESSSSDAESLSDQIRCVLLGENESENDNASKPLFTDYQLINFLLGAAAAEPHRFLPRLLSAADSNPRNRKVFVLSTGQGQGQDVTSDAMTARFSRYGHIEDLGLDADKGCWFVLFRTHSAAWKALKKPMKRIQKQPFFCCPATPPPDHQATCCTSGGRLIHVTNVPLNHSKENLKALFAEFGEIESGPIMCKVYIGTGPYHFAAVVYETREGAKKALEKPYKIFEGHEIHCQTAALPRGCGPVTLLPPKQPAMEEYVPHVRIMPKVPPQALLAEKPERVMLSPTPPAPGQCCMEMSDYDDDSSPDRIRCLLELFTVDQLIEFLSHAAADDPRLATRILSIAHDSDMAYRKILVHGLPLGWDRSMQAKLRLFLTEFGEIEAGSTIEYDRITKRARGAATFVYKTRQGANKALENPIKMFEGNKLICHLEHSPAATPLDGKMAAVVAAAAHEMLLFHHKSSGIGHLVESIDQALRDGNESEAVRCGRQVVEVLTDMASKTTVCEWISGRAGYHMLQVQYRPKKKSWRIVMKWNSGPSQ